MAAPGNAYPAVQLDSRGQVVDSGVVVQFTDVADQPGSGGGGNPGLYMTPISGTPTGVVTPTGIGYQIQDQANGAVYIAIGVTTTSWVQVGGAYDGTTANGVGFDGDNRLIAPGGVGPATVLFSTSSGPPSSFVFPLMYDITAVTGGLYAWDGGAYVQVSNVVA